MGINKKLIVSKFIDQTTSIINDSEAKLILWKMKKYLKKLMVLK